MNLRSLKYIVPLVVFAGLVFFLAKGLKLNPREVPSPFIGKPAPTFTLPALGQPDRRVAPADFQGQVWVLNVWASWCVPCRIEHPLLVKLAQQKLAPVVGLNYKDPIEGAQRFLRQLGDPYVITAVDADGRAAIDWGVYGVPETFVIDKAGIVRFKHVGPLTEDVVAEEIVPLLRRLNS